MCQISVETPDCLVLEHILPNAIDFPVCIRWIVLSSPILALSLYLYIYIYIYWVYPNDLQQWMIMVSLFNNDDNCLLTVAGKRTDPRNMIFGS